MLDKTHVGAYVSKDTLRPQDLICEFADYLQIHAPEEMDSLLDDDVIRIIETALHLSVHVCTNFENEDMELAMYVLEELSDKLNDIAPEGCVFGAHPGNGSLFGFYPPEDSDLWEGFEFLS